MTGRSVTDIFGVSKNIPSEAPVARSCCRRSTTLGGREFTDRMNQFAARFYARKSIAVTAKTIHGVFYEVLGSLKVLALRLL